MVQNYKRNTELTKLYSDNVIELACRRALSFEITSYSKIRNICRTGSYQLPLDNLYNMGEDNE